MKMRVILLLAALFMVLTIFIHKGLHSLIPQRNERSIMPVDKEEMHEAYTSPEQVVHDGKDSMLYTFKKYDLFILAFTVDFDFLYSPHDTLSVHEVGEKQGYRYLINGSYFEHSGEHAGLLQIPGVHHLPLKEDRQLSHVVVSRRGSRELRFIPSPQWPAGESADAVAFQTGPLVIDRTRLAQASIDNSINGRGSYARTLLGYSEEDRTTYFLIAKEAVQLGELGTYLLTLSIFQGKTLSVVNLDGGPSVSLYVQTHPEFSYNIGKRLPILLGVR